MPMEKRPMLSVVIPCFNEEPNLPLLYRRLQPVLESTGYAYELLFVDDGSADGTFAAVKALHTQDSRVGGLSFSRNFGHQIALLAGMQAARGELVLSMDADLQHPPETIPLLLAKSLEGYDIVNTRRIDHARIGYFKKASSGLFYRLLSYLSEIKVEPAAADFRLMNRRATDAFLQLPERGRFTRGMVSWMGFRQAIVEYQAQERAAGQSKYSLSKMLRLGLDGIAAFSSRPLRISFFTGLIISGLGLAYGLYILAAFIAGQTIQGWASMMLTQLIIGGAVLINLGIVGEYIARIFNEVKARPLYFIQEQVACKEERQDIAQD
jgi:polyisoprenyl-phosphate glycosyltransferase